MFIVTKRLTSFINYGPPFLMANVAWAIKANFLWIKADDGNSRLTFKYGRGINSVGTASSRPVKTGDIVELDAPSVITGNPATYITIDNGEPPTSGTGTATQNSDFFDVYPGSNDVPQYERLKLSMFRTQIDRVVCLDGSGALTTGTVTFQLDGGNDLSLDDFNTAVAPIPESEYRNNDHDMTFGLSLANNLVGSVEIFYK